MSKFWQSVAHAVNSMAQTWDDAGTTFTAIKMDVTDTNSDASSLLLDLLLDSASNFSVGKNLMEKKNGTAAQTFNIYNTFTDASNYERGFAKWESNVLKFGMEGAGTGNNARVLQLVTGGSAQLEIVSGSVIAKATLRPDTTAGTRTLGTDSQRWSHLYQDAAYHQMTEMVAPSAPASDEVRLFAQDNGAGKTQLMALFSTGAAQQVAIEP